ncbi:MAG: glycine cleavage system aminomethyltransferase GcvT [Candidatus Paceibacterota bacterium]|jgi:aminomethyltransferase|nr:glycine cleavage system aminomethyltransferase GcvT [Candidatus Paceibacterota bacterium]
MSKLLHTPLTYWHVDAGAKMAEFAGYAMPINYPTGALKEIKAVREAAGLFDISHMRPIFVEGTLAREFLNFIDTRDLSKMKIGDARYGIVCEDNGEPIDDIIVYMLANNRYMVISNASNGTRVVEHLRKVKKDYAISNEQVKITDGFGEYGFISLQGPKAERILGSVANCLVIPKKNYSCAPMLPVCGYPALVAKTGYTGEEGFEILCKKDTARKIWTKLLEVGEPLGLIPCGLASRDTLRLEAGMPLFGHEMDKDHDPITAGLGRYVDFNKHGYFLGKTALEKVRDGKTKWRTYLLAYIMEKGRIPRHGDSVYFRHDHISEYSEIGKLTSGGFSPTLGKNIAMGFSELSLFVGDEVFVQIGGKLSPATVTKLPFYKRAKK